MSNLILKVKNSLWSITGKAVEIKHFQVDGPVNDSGHEAVITSLIEDGEYQIQASLSPCFSFKIEQVLLYNLLQTYKQISKYSEIQISIVGLEV